MITQKIISFLVLQIAVVLIFIIVSYYLVRKITANRFNQKFANFVNNDEDKSDHSLEHVFILYFLYIIKGISFILNKNNYIKKKVKKYNRYLFIDNNYLTNNMDYLSLKLFVTFLISIIGINFLLFSFNYYNLLLVFLVIFVTYWIIDIIYQNKYRHALKVIDRDLLESIHLINASLNAGQSISQAIFNALNQTNGILKKEFTNVYEDISNGLSIESSFKSMYKRLPIATILYLSTTLQLFSKVGGSINDSFMLLEDDYEKKIVNNTTFINMILPYRFIALIIGFIPVTIIMIKWFLNHQLFNKFMTSDLGIWIAGIIVLLNISYYIVNHYLMGDDTNV